MPPARDESSTSPTPGERRVFSVEIETDDGVLRGRLGVPRAPMGLAGLAPVAYHLTDALVAHAIAAESNVGRVLSCGPGCGACCRHMVPISPPEALHMMGVVERLPVEQRDALMQRFDAIVQVLQAEQMIDELLAPKITNDTVLPVARRYFALQQACPFLENESCGFHAHRPVACRDYNVTSPPEWCRRPYEHDIAKIPLPLPFSTHLARLAARLTAIRPQLIPITLVPGWVSQHEHLARQRWPGEDLFREFVAETGGQVRIVDDGA
ncbi:MAG: hypothetical protein D6744_13510 [Planctomycetota bacterium]|nr:MAG: hypothetical protein D6744_13510 [Planctomycetota bacterium]